MEALGFKVKMSYEQAADPRERVLAYFKGLARAKEYVLDGIEKEHPEVEVLTRFWVGMKMRFVRDVLGWEEVEPFEVEDIPNEELGKWIVLSSPTEKIEILHEMAPDAPDPKPLDLEFIDALVDLWALEQSIPIVRTKIFDYNVYDLEARVDEAYKLIREDEDLWAQSPWRLVKELVPEENWENTPFAYVEAVSHLVAAEIKRLFWR